MGVGYYLGSIATTVSMVNAMIILVSIGTAFFKGNVSAVNGQLLIVKKNLIQHFQYSILLLI